jgi:hypothetical protein
VVAIGTGVANYQARGENRFAALRGVTGVRAEQKPATHDGAAALAVFRFQYRRISLASDLMP